MAIREGRWRCPSCGAENRGRNESCAGLDGHGGCGAARPAGVTFYLPGDAPAVSDAGLLADALSGQDWICDHCQGANPNAVNGRRVTRCRHCGQAREAGDPSLEVRHYGPGEVPTEPVTPERPDRRAARADLPAGRGRTRPTVLALLAAVLLAVAAWWAWPRTHEGQVAELSWERTVAIEALVTHVEGDWSVPSGGRQLSSERRIRSYRDVVDHYETRTRQVSDRVPSGTESYSCGSTDLGNGYFQDRTCTRTTYTSVSRTESYQAPVYRQEPVYDQWYSFEIDRWEPGRVLEAHGGDTQPTWPEVRLAGPREREGARKETYVAILEDEQGRVRAEPGLAEWLSLDPGQEVRWSTSPLKGLRLMVEPGAAGEPADPGPGEVDLRVDAPHGSNGTGEDEA